MQKKQGVACFGSRIYLGARLPMMNRLLSGHPYCWFEPLRINDDVVVLQMKSITCRQPPHRIEKRDALKEP